MVATEERKLDARKEAVRAQEAEDKKKHKEENRKEPEKERGKGKDAK